MENFYIWLAWKLPKRLAYWAAVRVSTFASGTDEFAKTEPGKIPVTKALEAWRTWA